MDEEDEIRKLQEDENFIEKDKDSEKDEHEDAENQISFSEDSEDFEYKEKELNLKNEMKVLLDYSIISRIFSIFNFQNNLKNDNLHSILYEIKKDHSNVVKFISKLFDRIINSLNQPWIFYQMEYLYTFHILINDPFFSKDIYFQSLYNIILVIINNFFNQAKTNKLIIIESLFRFNSSLLKDGILSNYEEIIIEQQNTDQGNKSEFLENNNYETNINELEYDGTNINMIKIVDENKKNKRKKDCSPTKENEITEWTENEDLLLIKTYLEFGEHEEVLKILESSFTMKSFKEIKKRIIILKLKKGEKKAMKMFKKIHKKKPEKEEKLFNIIIELSDECRNETKKLQLQKTIFLIKDQLESFKVRKGLLENISELECRFIPTSEEEIETMKDNKFQYLIKNIGLIPPQEFLNLDYKENKLSEVEINDEKYFWKLDPKCDSYEISIMIEKFTNFERIINEKMEIDDPEREHNNDKAKEERKHENKDKKHKIKIKKEKEERRRRKSFEELENNKYVSENERIENSIRTIKEDNKTPSKNSQIIDYRSSKTYLNSSNRNLNDDKNSYKSKTPTIIENTYASKKKRLKKGLKTENDDNFNFN